MLTVYGIKNCDTMHKAFKWLTARGTGFKFHDYKASGIDAQRLGAWCERLGWETVLNRSGTTFRKLPEADREGLNPDKAVALMLAQPSMIRRPIFETGDHIIAGFKPDAVAALEKLLTEA